MSQPHVQESARGLRLFEILPSVAVTVTVLAFSERDAAALVIAKHGPGALGDGTFREIPMEPGIVAEAWE